MCSHRIHSVVHFKDKKYQIRKYYYFFTELISMGIVRPEYQILPCESEIMCYNYFYLPLSNYHSQTGLRLQIR